MVDELHKNTDFFKQNENEVLRAKVVVIGDMSVGKTSLSIQFTQGQFKGDTQHTIGASYFVRSLEIDDKKIMFQIWDTAGQERFRSLVPMYLRDTKIAILVFDVTSKESFDNIERWRKELCSSAPSNVKSVLVGNKSDLSEEREVNNQDAYQYASTRGMAFVETSAKLGTNIDKLFYDIGEWILSNDTGKPASDSNGAGTSVFHIDNKNFGAMSHRRCC